MSEMDQLLQKKLEALENGQTLDQVLQDIPDNASELRSLLRLSTTLGGMPHPKLQASAVQAFQKDQLPIRQPAASRPAWPWMRVTVLAGLSGAAIIFIFAVFALAGLGLWFAGPRSAHLTTLVDASGSIQAASGPLSNDWAIVTNGSQMRAGQRIRTASDSSVTLLFFEGSRVTLAPNSQVTISELKGSWNKSLVVVLTQETGNTTHHVIPLRGANSSYQVVTPSGTANVLGTQFEVGVDQNGQTRFAVDTGKIEIIGQESQVLLAAGQATYALPGQLPEQPAYQFSLRGKLAIPTGNIGSVNGVIFRLTPATHTITSPLPGSDVEVQGRIINGERVADHITPVKNISAMATFTGILESMQGDVWQVGGVSIHIDSNTELDSDLAIGMPVKVKFIVLENGDWLALEIEALSEEPPTPEPTAAITETITPTLTLTTTVTITPSITITPTVFVNCTGANPHPKGQELANRYAVPYEEIMGWFCKGYGFGEIDLAWGLSRQYGLPVEEIFALRASGLGWGQIKQLLARGTPTPTAVITPTPVITATLVVTPTPPALATATPIPPTQPARSCRSADPHPTGTRLAAQFGVSYDEIMGWFCQGFGFGEIEHAYNLSRQTGKSVSEIFGMRSSGLGWGQIEALLNPKPDKPKKKP